MEKYVLLTLNYRLFMPNPFFSFKKFTVYHDRCAMKVGTDGVLLGAWANLSNSQYVLDIGTGTGLITLMLAQRNENIQITAIDIDQEAVEQAEENFISSPWKDRINVKLQDVVTYQPINLFDTIVSNPPYFTNSLKCPNEQRSTARHTDTLSIDNLLARSSELLSEKGKVSFVFPYDQTEKIIQIAQREGLFLSRYTKVKPRPDLPPKRSLLEFGKEKVNCEANELTIELSRHIYTDDYIALTRDFYLKM